ncbi:hypothetical protein [Fulvimarina sp. MAC8]|uniref:hypothetical protein n=1 Tax=Fulvimarina sp. MAC8 TaxID=3162874 RepID=UPI0032EF018E
MNEEKSLCQLWLTRLEYPEQFEYLWKGLSHSVKQNRKIHAVVIVIRQWFEAWAFIACGVMPSGRNGRIRCDRVGASTGDAGGLV